MKRLLPHSLRAIRHLVLPLVFCLVLGPVPLRGADADNDGIDDAWEVAHGLDPADPADGLLDPDGDGLTNLQEFVLNTDPQVADTDGDTVSDGTEVDSGMDPLTPALEGNGYRYEERVAEDAEDGATTGWTVVAGTGSQVLNTIDSVDGANRVIAFTTEGAVGDALFRLVLSPAEQRHLKLSWRMNFSSTYVVYVSCQTSLGHRFLAYHSANSVQSGGEYVRYALGASAGIGQWASFHRDLVADLVAVEPTATLQSIDSIYVRGVGQTDDIVFSAYPDADRDLIPDTVETAYGLDPNDPADALADPDGDGLTSLREFYLGTSPVAADTDGDGLSDGDEVLIVGTDPVNPDTDGDTVADGTEVASGMDPLVPALPGPGYSYDLRMVEDAEDGDALGWDLWDADPYGEAVNVEDPDDPANRVIQFQSVYGTAHRIYVLPYDTRKDVIQWRMRFSGSYYFFVYCRTSVGTLYIRYYSGTALSQVGADPGIGIGTGLASGHWVTVRRNLVADLRTLYPDADLYEVRAFVARGGGYVDDICLLAYPDTDHDLIPDTVEIAAGLDPEDPTDAAADLDGDGLMSLREFYLGTDPLSFDTDSDGLSDGEEVSLGTDPLAVDTDGDTVSDGTEVDSGMDPLTPALEGNGYRYEELVAEDAEDGDTAGWSVVGGTGSALANAIDTADAANRVIAFTTEGATGDALFRLAFSPAESRHLKLSWRLNFGSGYVVYVSCQTSLGHRYLAYHSANSVQSGGEYVRYALGVSAGIGQWATFHRDLVADLAAGEPTAVLQSIDSIYVRGVGQIDDIVFSAYPDADRDLIPDTVETAYGLDPDDPADALADPDGDGLSSLQEFYLGTSPVAADTDGDGLNDGAEVGLGTDPLNADGDGDGLNDGDEVALGTNPLSTDSDGDSLSDSDELALGTSPVLADTDGDGLSDSEELNLGTDPLVADTDGDGLADGAETARGTDPLVADTDGDGLADGREVALGTDPLSADTDGDTLSDSLEVLSGMDPLVPALQGDGYLYEERVAEDAEDGETTGWSLPYADPPGEVLNAVDSTDSANRVILFTTEGASGDALYRLLLSPAEQRRFKLSWRLNFTSGHAVYVSCQTSLGHRFLAYYSSDSVQSEGEYVRYAIGSGTGVNQWATFHRDLVADLAAGEPTAVLQSIDSIYVRGVGQIDDIVFSAYPDADRDLIPDTVETAYGLDPDDPADALADPDGDGLASLREFQLGTNPTAADSDSDGLDDGDELLVTDTDPLSPDEDNDGILDGQDTALPGLAAAYFAGEFTAVPAFDLINHYGVGRVPNLAWPHEEGECVDSGRSVAVAALIVGSLHVPEDGTYEFKVTCNDGVRLLVDGTEVLLLQYSGYLGYATVPLVRTFSLPLTAGSHDFRAEYFQLRGDRSLMLAWRASANAEFVTVPTAAFSFDPAWLLAMAATIDTDGDGLYDREEATLGTSATVADSDGDGLSDAEEVRVHFTDPLAADTDGDGVSDYLEVTSSLTDPLVAEFDGTETVVSTVAGSSFAGLVGTWAVDGGAIAARDRQGTVTASLPVATAGVYVLEVAGTQDNTLSTIGEFVLDGYVDSCYVGRVVLDAPAGTVGTGRYYLPWLAAGDHSIAIQWRNTETNSFLRLVSVSLLEIGGVDADGDGIADWIETRDALTQYDVPEATVTMVSPYFIEGTAAHVDLVDLRSSYVPDDTALATDADGLLVNAVQHGVAEGWYANLPLSPQGTTEATLTVGNGLRSQDFSVLWEPTDVFSTEEITLRVGDSLLLAAYVGNGNGNGNGHGPVTIEVEGNSFTTTPGGTVPYQFLNHGTVTVNAAFAPGNGKGKGNHQEGQLVVHVVGGTLSGRPTAFVGCQRRWDNPSLTDDVLVQYDSHLSMVELATSGEGRSFTIRINDDRPAHVVARLGEDGPIVSGTTVDAVTFATSADTGFAVVKEYSDGSQLIEGRITLGYVPEDIELHIHIFVGGVTFEDGTIDKVFTAADFSATGELRFRFIRAEDGYTAACHYIQFYQGGVLVKLGP